MELKGMRLKKNAVVRQHPIKASPKMLNAQIDFLDLNASNANNAAILEVTRILQSCMRNSFNKRLAETSSGSLSVCSPQPHTACFSNPNPTIEWVVVGA